MRVYDLIWKKREGGELSSVELGFLVDGFVKGEIPDYQMSAWCMAVYFRGMTFEECTALTLAMANSGETVDLSSLPGIKVDKHSTGGVGDKTSLVLLPLVAAAGIPVAKMSGRGLGHTGGTIDKLESIPGFRTSLTQEEFMEQVRRCGIALIGQTGNLVPADKKLYALRDLTATVESIPLIASSIVSKKLAAGADAVVLDVKFGDGAFMHDYDQALRLAQTMVEIGNRAGRRFRAILSNMDQPLGWAIGNSLEVAEAIQTLKGEGPSDLTELCIVLGGTMVQMAGLAATKEAGERLVRELLHSGKGLAKLAELIKAQGGNPAVLDDPALLPHAAVMESVKAPADGWVAGITCRELGLATMRLGAGRTRLGEAIRPEAGLKVFAKVGDFVKAGTVIAEVHAVTPGEAASGKSDVLRCFTFSQKEIPHPELIRGTVGNGEKEE